MTQFKVSLPAETATRLRREAQEHGVSAEEVAAEALEAWVSDDVLDSGEDARRLAEAGEDTDASVVFAELRADIESARRIRP